MRRGDGSFIAATEAWGGGDTAGGRPSPSEAPPPQRFVEGERKATEDAAAELASSDVGEAVRFAHDSRMAETALLQSLLAQSRRNSSNSANKHSQSQDGAATLSAATRLRQRLCMDAAEASATVIEQEGAGGAYHVPTAKPTNTSRWKLPAHVIEENARRSPLVETALLFVRLLVGGMKTIIFCKVWVNVNQILQLFNAAACRSRCAKSPKFYYNTAKRS